MRHWSSAAAEAGLSTVESGPAQGLREQASISPAWTFDDARETHPDQWNALVAELGGNVFHHYCYGPTLYNPSNSKPFYARLVDPQGRCAGAAMGAIQGSRLWPVGAIFKHAHLSALPLSRNGASAKDSIESLGRVLRKQGVFTLTVDSYGAPPGCEFADSPVANVVPRAEFHLDLRPGTEILWKAMAGTRRTQIRRAEREGLALRLGWDLEDVQSLGRLIQGSAQRFQQSSGEHFESPGPEKLELLWQHLVRNRLATVFLAEKDGQPLSANLVCLWNGEAYNLLAGSNLQGFKIGAASWLYWEIIKRLEAEGVADFNLGGVDPEGHERHRSGHGLYAFKADFGARLLRCCNVRIILRPNRYRLYQAVGNLRTRGRRVMARGAGSK